MPTNSPDIKQFLFNKALPYKDRLFFVQHLAPYEFFYSRCKNKNVLEIGIGDGFGSYHISVIARKVIAVDADLSRYNSLKKYIETYSRYNIRFINADGLGLPFKDESLDRVITCQVIEHIPEDKLSLFLREINRVLKNDGLCLFSTLNVENNIKNVMTYEKFYQHHKEFNKDEFGDLLSQFFAKVSILGLDVSMKHRIFRRLKRWGLMEYKIKGYKPVRNFYDNVSLSDFKITPKVSRHSLDLIGLCTKL